MTVPLQSGSNQATTSVTVAFASTTPGSFLVAYVGSTTNGRTASASDNVNGAYNTDASAASSCSICTIPVNAGGAITVTGTISGAAGGTIQLIVEEWPPTTVAPSPFDKSATGTATATNTLTTSTTSTLSAASELILAMCSLNSTGAGSSPVFAIQSPYTPGPSSPEPNTVNAALATGYQFVGSTAGVNAIFNWENNETARACIATYKLSPQGYCLSNHIEF
jgi:hypothetical protein